MTSPQQLLHKHFGHGQFRGRQQEVIQHLLAGRHVLVIMPTGMGKSVCYQIPAVADSGSVPHPEHAVPGNDLTLVLSPLIALMKDQVDALQRANIDAAYVNSSLSRQQRQHHYAAIRAGHYRLLYVTPERFRKDDFVKVIQQRHIKLLAVDEAHCISQWGHDFRPDYSRVAAIRQLLGNPTTVALTATATPEVQSDIIEQLGLRPDQVQLVHEGINRPNLRLTVDTVWDDDEKEARIRSILSEPDLARGSGIVYFTLIKTLQHFSDRLTSANVPHVCYHGELDRTARRRIQDQFMTGESKLVLATNAFGMGIDKEDIRFVVHAEVPGSMEAYYQEIGRAGRDGKPSQCTLLYNERDLATQMEFIAWSNPDAEFYRQTYDYLINDSERVRAFGFDWLNDQLQSRSKHDHRLETVLAMFDRYDVVAGSQPPACFQVQAEVPEGLFDEQRIQDKLLRDQKKLYALVQYVNDTGDRKAFIHEYFGLPYEA